MNKKNALKIGIAVVFVCVSFVLFLLWEGILFFHAPLEKNYPVKGIDVSHYQGEIDWKNIKKDMDITFAFIKATEGSNHLDENFKQNWKNAQKSGLYIGAYHFFSFESEGKTQAKNFIKNVKAFDNMLPPVVDVEYYSGNGEKLPSVQELREQLDAFLYELEEEYQCKPIIYTTMSVYSKYINEYYNAYPLWIRNTYYRPFLFKNRQWTFWQYSENGEWPYAKDTTVDRNVFAGSLKSFLRYFNLEE